MELFEFLLENNLKFFFHQFFGSEFVLTISLGLFYLGIEISCNFNAKDSSVFQSTATAFLLKFRR